MAHHGRALGAARPVAAGAILVGRERAALGGGAGQRVVTIRREANARNDLAALAQIAFAMTRSLILRAIIAAVFALPAAFAGYHVVLAMTQIGVPSLVWREVFACVGAVFIGGTAWTRLAVFTEPRPVEPGRAVGNSPQPVLAAAMREGMISSPSSSNRFA